MMEKDQNLLHKYYFFTKIATQTIQKQSTNKLQISYKKSQAGGESDALPPAACEHPLHATVGKR
jgi:hypothetical protein